MLANVTAASAPDETINPTCVHAISRRRSMESAMDPPINEKAINGTTSATPIKPTAKFDPDKRNTWYGTATYRICVPINETICPSHSARYATDSRSGEMSTASERARASRLRATTV